MSQGAEASEQTAAANGPDRPAPNQAAAASALAEPKGRATIEREARVAGLRDFAAPTLEAIERRRWQLWLIAAFTVVGMAVGMVFLSLESVSLPRIDFLPLYTLRILFVGFASLISLYLFDRDYRLRRLTRTLVDERVLNAALSNRLKEVSVLSEVGKAINQLLDLEDVLQMILNAALDLLIGDEGSIMLLDEGRGELVVAVAQTNREDLVKGASVRVGKGVAGWVAEHKEPLLISGRAPSEFFVDFTRKERRIYSSMCVPLLSANELYGVLNVNSLSGKRDFSEYDLRALGLFAQHGAIAIRNARAYEQERQAIARLQEIDRMKTDFVATVSHELRTPLTSIIGAARTMRVRAGDLTEEDRFEFLQMVERQGNRLLRIIEEILSAARLESGHALRRVPFDIVEVTREIIQGYEAEGQRNRITIDSPAALTAFGDPTAFEQILTNLADNSLKYSDPGTPVKVRIWEEARAIGLELIDEGHGISHEAIPTIFDRFRQVEEHTMSRAGGVGLGLYIVKNLVTALGGNIDVKSAEGKGSTFTVMFPKRKEE